MDREPYYFTEQMALLDPQKKLGEQSNDSDCCYGPFSCLGCCK